MICEQYRLGRVDDTYVDAKNASKNLSVKFISLNHSKIEQFLKILVDHCILPVNLFLMNFYLIYFFVAQLRCVVNRPHFEAIIFYL